MITMDHQNIISSTLLWLSLEFWSLMWAPTHFKSKTWIILDVWLLRSLLSLQCSKAVGKCQLALFAVESFEWYFLDIAIHLALENGSVIFRGCSWIGVATKTNAFKVNLWLWGMSRAVEHTETEQTEPWTGDPLAYTIACRWGSDQEQVVLEVSSENSKATTDAEPCSIRSLLREMEETNIIDTKLHAHDCARPGPQDVTPGGHSLCCLGCCGNDCNHLLPFTICNSSDQFLFTNHICPDMLEVKTCSSSRPQRMCRCSHMPQAWPTWNSHHWRACSRTRRDEHLLKPQTISFWHVAPSQKNVWD